MLERTRPAHTRHTRARPRTAHPRPLPGHRAASLTPTPTSNARARHRQRKGKAPVVTRRVHTQALSPRHHDAEAAAHGPRHRVAAFAGAGAGARVRGRHLGDRAARHCGAPRGRRVGASTVRRSAVAHRVRPHTTGGLLLVAAWYERGKVHTCDAAPRAHGLPCMGAWARPRANTAPRAVLACLRPASVCRALAPGHRAHLLAVSLSLPRPAPRPTDSHGRLTLQPAGHHVLNAGARTRGVAASLAGSMGVRNDGRARLDGAGLRCLPGVTWCKRLPSPPTRRVAARQAFRGASGWLQHPAG